MDLVFVTIKALAEEFGIDRSTVKRYARGKGLHLRVVRTLESGNQKALAMTVSEAALLRQMRSDEGFTGKGGAVTVGPVGPGWLYIVQPVPEYDPQRVKLGFAAVVQQRLDTYRTICPQAAVLRAWPCQSAWERTAMASITREACVQEGAEVFRCDDLEGLIERAEAFFKLMPSAPTVGPEPPEATPRGDA